MMTNLVRLGAAALLVAACAPVAGGPSSAPSPSGAVTEAGLLRLADRREFDEPYLRAALAHRNPAVARRAAWVLANLRDPAGVPLLAQAMARTDTAVLAMAAFALGQIADSAGVAPLLPFADAARAQAMPTVVAEVAYALGKIRHPQARAALETLLRTLPRAGTAETNDVAGAALLAIWRQGRPLPVSAIDPWIRHADPEVRWRAAYALARRTEPQAAAVLFRAVGDSDPLVRSFVARGLTGPMADSSGVGRVAARDAVLRLATADPEQIVRINALRTLGSYGGDYYTPAERAVLDALVRVAGGKDAYEATTAIESLQRLGADPNAARLRVVAQTAGPPLGAILADAARPVSVRTAAMAALAEVDPPAALVAARTFSTDPAWRLRAAAARAFAQLGEGGRDDFRRMARDPDGRVVAAAVEEAVTMSRAGEYDVYSIGLLLEELLAHPDVMVRANALGGMALMAEHAPELSAVLDAYERAQRDTLNDAALAAIDAIAAHARREPAASRRFFTRFPRSADYLVRQRVQSAFGDTVPGAWTQPLPIETGMSMDDYARVVRETRARPRPRAVIETSRGEMELELFADDAPLTVRSFLSLAARGFFDGQEWPRVVPNFVIQGGDPRGDTSGGPGYSIRDEINRDLYLRGSLGMALSGPDTGGSQWFVTHSPQPHLDGTYTVFGRVVRGMEVADVIVPGDRIIRIREVR